MLASLFVCYLVFIIPLHAARGAMAAGVGFLCSPFFPGARPTEPVIVGPPTTICLPVVTPTVDSHSVVFVAFRPVGSYRLLGHFGSVAVAFFAVLVP